MAATQQNLLIFGATGYIGAYIVEEIIKNKTEFGRIVIITSPTTAESKAKRLEKLKGEGIEVNVADVTKAEDVSKAYEGIDTVISAVGRNALAEQINWIYLAEKSPSVKRFFPSEFGTDIEHGPKSAGENTHQLKIKVRAALKLKSDLDYTHVVTGPYADGEMLAYLSALPEESAEIGTYDVKGKKAVVIGDGKGKISLTTPKDVGKLVIKALLHPEASKNRALKVNSFTTTPLDIVAEFEKQTGDKWDIAYTPLDTLRKSEKLAWEKKNPMAPLFTLRRIWAEGGTLYEKRDNHLIDAEDMDNLEDAVRDAIATQRSGADGASDKKLQ